MWGMEAWMDSLEIDMGAIRLPTMISPDWMYANIMSIWEAKAIERAAKYAHEGEDALARKWRIKGGYEDARGKTRKWS